MPVRADAPGLRERKRLRTRRTIFDAAFRLFAEHGFDHVTLTQVAAEAEVAPATLFIHYASKEDLFFSLREEFEAAIPEAIEGAATRGELLQAVRDYFLACADIVLDPEVEERSRTFARILLASPTLTRAYAAMVRERQALLLTLLGSADHETALFAAFAHTAGTYSREVLHRELAEGVPAAEIRAHVVEALEVGFGRLAQIYTTSR